MKRLSFLISSLCMLMTLHAAVPYFITPQDFEQGLPDGWTIDYSSLPSLSDGNNHHGIWRHECASDTTLLVNPDGAYSGSCRMAVRTTNPEEYCVRLVTPALDVHAADGQPVLRFAHAQNGITVAGKVYMDTLSVYVRPNATMPWQLLHRYTEPIAAWHVDELPLDNYNIGTAYQIAFEAKDGNGQGVVLDDVCVYVPSHCTDVRYGMLKITARESIIELMQSSVATTYELVASLTPMTDFSAAALAAAAYHATQPDNEFVINTLTANTDYYIYARTDCQDNETGYTNWVENFIHTPMLATLPYTENFNTASIPAEHGNFRRLDGWTMSGLNDNGPVVFTGSMLSSNTARKNIWKLYSEDKTAFLAFCHPDTVAGRIVEPVTSAAPECILPGEWQYAASPEIDGDLRQCQVCFWGTAYSSYFGGVLSGSSANDFGAEITVGVMSDVRNFRSFRAIETVHVDHAYQFKRFAVSLASAPAGYQHVVLLVQSSKGTVFFVDNFEVKPVTAATAVPTQVAVTNVTPSGFDVTATAATMDIRVYLTTNYKDGLVMPAASVTPLFTQDGATGTVHVSLPASAQGQAVSVYVGQGGNWAFPHSLRVPTEITALPYSLDFNTPAIIGLKKQGAEIASAAPASNGAGEVFWPLGSWINYPQAQTDGPLYDGGYGLKLYGIDNYIVLPYLDNVTECELEFYLSAGSSNYAGCSRVAVGVMTDPYDLSTFTQLYTVEGAAGDADALNTAYFKSCRALDGYTGTGKYIAIRAIAPSQSFILGSKNFIDNITVRTIEPCRAATGLVATAGASSVSLHWEDNNMTAWKVGVYRDLALTQPVIEQVVTGQPNVVLSGLEFHTDYVAAVRTICGNDTITDAARAQFTTMFGLPYTQEWTVPTGSRLPVDWTTALAGASYPNLTPAKLNTWRVESCANMADRHFTHTSVNKSKHALVSPIIAVANDASNVLRVSFTLCESIAPAEEVEGIVTGPDEDQRQGLTFAVMISDNGGSTWRIIDGWGDHALNPAIRHSIDDIPTTAQRYTYVLPGYEGKNVQLAFYAYSADVYTWTSLHIGNLKLDAVPADCGGVSSISLRRAYDRSASIEWEAQGNPNMNVEISTDPSFQLARQLTASATPFTITGLQPNTLYYVRARQACDGEGDWASMSFRTACSAVTPQELGLITFGEGDVSVRCWEMNVDRVGTGSTVITPAHVVTESGHNLLEIYKPANVENDKYGNDYDAVMPDLAIDDINDYQLIFHAKTRSVAHNIAYLTVGVYTEYGIYTPMDSIRLTNRMTEYRVSLADYQVEIAGDVVRSLMFRIAAPADSSNVALLDSISLRLLVSECDAPTALTIDSVGMATVKLSWQGDAAGDYIVEVASDRQFAHLVARDSIHGLSGIVGGLSAVHSYYARVAHVCSRETSDYSSPVSFTTRNGLTAITVNAVTDQSLTCSVSGVEPDLVAYEVAVSTGTVSNPATLSATTFVTDTFTIKGLSDGKQYHIYVRAINLHGDTTEWISTTAFTAYVLPYQQAAPATANGWNRNATAWAESPLICSHGNRVVLSYDLSASAEVSLFVSTDVGQTWTNVETLTGAVTGHVVDLTSLCAGQTFVLQFRSSASVNLSALRNVVLDVAAPLYPRVADIGGDYATIAVTGLEPGCRLIYTTGYLPHTPSLVDAMEADSIVFTVQGLLPGTKYDAYVAAVTATDETSAWYGPIDWETACGLFLLTPETFSNTMSRHTVGSGTNTYPMQNCWTTICTPAGTYADYCQPRIMDDNELYHYVYAHTGTGALRMYSNAVTSSFAIMPELAPELSFDSLEVTFWGRPGFQSYNYIAGGDASSARAITVGVMTNPNDANTFTPIQKISVEQVFPAQKAFVADDPEGTLYWRHYTVSLLGAQGRYLAFKSDGVNQFYIDDVMLQIRQGCSTPTGLKADVLSRSVVNLTWSGASARYAVELSDVYGTPLGTDTVTMTQLQYTNLDPGTSYYVRIKGLCSDGESAYSESLRFTTALGISYAEDFDEVTTLVPDLWRRYRGQFTNGVLTTTLAEQGPVGSQLNNLATDGFEVGAYGAANLIGFTGNWLNYQYYYNNRYTWIVSPTLDLTDVTDEVRMSFEIAASAVTNDATNLTNSDQLRYIISEDGGNSWKTANATVVPITSLSTEATYMQADLSKYRGKTIAVAFYASQTGSMERHKCIHIDNFRVEALNPDCGGVRTLRSHLHSLDSVQLTWVIEGNDSVNVYIVSEGGKVAADTIVAGSSYMHYGLDAHTTYNARVEQLCSGSVVKTSLHTPLSVPMISTFSTKVDGFEWTRRVITGDSGDRWQIINSNVGQHQMLPGMTEPSGYYQSVNGNIASRLESPDIVMPVLQSNEEFYLTFWLGMHDASSAPMSGADQDDRFSVQVSTNSAASWQDVAVFRTPDANSNQLVYGSQTVMVDSMGQLTINMSAFSGQTIRLGFYAASNSDAETGSDYFLVLDDAILRKVVHMDYTASHCSGSDYEDVYFTIPTADLVLGETLYERVVEAVSPAPDTIVQCTLNVLKTHFVELYDTLCAYTPYVRGDVQLLEPKTDTYRYSYTASNGCDSTVLIHMFVHPAKASEERVLRCLGDVYELGGKEYRSSQLIRDTITDPLTGCDSVHTVLLEFSPRSFELTELSVIACPGDLYINDIFEDALYKPGFYTATTTTAYGCDSTVNINFYVADANYQVFDTIMVADLPYKWNGEVRYTKAVPAGDYKFAAATECGATATVFLHIGEPTGWNYLYGLPAEEKFILDGHLYIRVGEHLFDASGRRL